MAQTLSAHTGHSRFLARVARILTSGGHKRRMTVKSARQDTIALKGLPKWFHVHLDFTVLKMLRSQYLVMRDHLEKNYF